MIKLNCLCLIVVGWMSMKFQAITIIAGPPCINITLNTVIVCFLFCRKLSLINRLMKLINWLLSNWMYHLMTLLFENAFRTNSHYKYITIICLIFWKYSFIKLYCTITSQLYLTKIYDTTLLSKFSKIFYYKNLIHRLFFWIHSWWKQNEEVWNGIQVCDPIATLLHVW